MSQLLMVLGYPKAGKTGSLASLANAGRTIRYLDFDNNVAPLKVFTKPDARSRIQRVACMDTYGTGVEDVKGGSSDFSVRMTEYKSWKTALQALEKWPVDGSDPRSWRNESVLVVDSLTALAQSRWRGVKMLNARKDARMMYKAVQDSIFDFLMWLKTELTCPVIVLSHIQMVGPDLYTDEEIEDTELQEQVMRKKLEAAEISQYHFGPITMGKAQATTLPALFAGVVLVEADEVGWHIYTRPRRGFRLAVPLVGVSEELDIKDGMETIMSAWAPMPKKSSTEKEKEVVNG